MTWEQADVPPWAFQNSAHDGSHVNVQGIVFGDSNTYVLGPDASPEEKFRKARNCLAAMNAAPARAWFKELVADGWTSNEVCYYWALSILSERPFGDLETHELVDLGSAFRHAGRNGADPWSVSVVAVRSLVECRRQQEQTGATSPDLLGEATKAYRRLQDERQNEIQAHLGLVMTGASLDQLEAEFAARVRVRRLGSNRKGRVWKFFEPVPERPRARLPEPPELSTVRGALAVCGATVTAAGILPAIVVTIVNSPLFGLAVLLLMAGSGILAACLGPRQFPSRYLVASGWPITIPDPAFQDSIRKTVQSVFDRQAWHAGAWWATWNAQTRRIRPVLTKEITGLYAEPRIQPGAVDWLIRWHAEDTFRRWRAGELKKRGASPLPAVGFALGVAGSAIATLFLLAALIPPLGATAGLLAMAIACGVLVLAASGVDVYLVRRRRLPAEQAAAKARADAEMAAYQRWCAVLADRPGDIEMARWLDDDKRYLVSMARNQYGLLNSDIIEHAVLTEPAPGSQRARVLYGMWRHTAYILWVYLLTEAGVRQIAISLDFATGVLSNQKRTTFRYDAIASAGVEEVGERVDDGLRETAVPEHGAAGAAPRLSLRQSFHLALVNGESFAITVKKVELPPAGPRHDDLPWLARLNLGPSGAVSTLKLLEEVAAEGGERVRRSRRRRQVPSFGDRPGPPPPRNGSWPSGVRETPQ